MKRLERTDGSARFSGGVRRHHRASGKTPSSWEEWVAGERAERPSRSWAVILGRALGLLLVLLAAMGVFYFVTLW